ncbi:MAG: hypothetical protein WB816_10815 [Methylocystis sp.]
MRLRIRPSYRDLAHEALTNDGAYKWNIFAGSENHPLREGRHGYLVHCLFDHNYLPWQLLPHIREVEVQSTFGDFETAWAAPLP